MTTGEKPQRSREAFEKYYLTTPLVDERARATISWEAYLAGRDVGLEEAARVCDDRLSEPHLHVVKVIRALIGKAAGDRQGQQ